MLVCTKSYNLGLVSIVRASNHICGVTISVVCERRAPWYIAKALLGEYNGQNSGRSKAETYLHIGKAKRS
jgi:hypothetical protein